MKKVSLAAFAIVGASACTPSASVQATADTAQYLQPTAVLENSGFGSGYQPRVYEYTPKGDPSKLCIVTTNVEGISTACFPKATPASGPK